MVYKSHIDDIPDILKFDSEENLFLQYDSGYDDKEIFVILFLRTKLEYL